MKKRLPVLGQVDHVVDVQLGGVAKRWNRGERFRSGRTPEIERDSEVEVEPLNLAMLDLGDNRRAKWLAYRAARTLQGTWEPRHDVPARRSECPPDRHHVGCGAYRCRAFLWRIDSEDRAGRPGLSKCARDEAGLTLSVAGDLGEERETTIVPRWLEGGTIAPSCAWDVIRDGVSLSNEQVGDALSRHRTLIGRVVYRALRSLRDQGFDLRDLLNPAEPGLSRVSAGRKGSK